MTKELEHFLSSYATLPPGCLQAITGCFQEKIFDRNELVLKEGHVCKDFIFVQSGCLRMFYISEETEISVWFAFPGSSAIEISSFISGLPSSYSIQAIENSRILYLPKTELEKLYQQYPVLQELFRKFWEDVVQHLLKRFTALQKETAENRYRDLLLNTDYLQKIPQKYLASFIGVTPTSFSRIKGQLQKT